MTSVDIWTCKRPKTGLIILARDHLVNFLSHLLTLMSASSLVMLYDISSSLLWFRFDSGVKALVCEFNSCSARYVSPNQHSSDPGFPFPGKRAAQVVEEGSTCPLEWRRRQSNTRADYRWVASLCRSLFLFLSRISQTLFGAVNL